MGYKFDDAILKCKSSEKIIYGTRTELFHIIGSDDRDFNTNYASTKSEAIELGEVKTILKSLGKL